MVNFKEEKEKLLDNLHQVSLILSEIKNKFSLNLDELEEKVFNSINAIKDDKFSVAFFGSFSSGKSTILSILTEIMDIKISPEPTTDKINVYPYDDYLLIDTPGLFSEKTQHDEITQKYISEANIVIYTIEPDNPIRHSHLDTLKWLLNTLQKIDSTIFVINKMDMVADLDEDADFNNQAEIKKKEVLKILYDVVGKKSDFKLICIAADPFAKGLQFWRDRLDEYKKLSRIQELESILSEFKERYRQELILKAGKSVIYDITNTTISELNKIKEYMDKQLEILKNQEKELSEYLRELRDAVYTAYQNITDEILNLREKLIFEIYAAASSNDLARFHDIYIGEEGYILERKIQDIIYKHTSSLNSKYENIQSSLREDFSEFYEGIQNKFFSQLSERGRMIAASILKIPTEKIAKTVLKLRDVLKLPIKFKPWQTFKIAKIIKGLPVIIGILADIKEILDSFIFQKKKEDLKAKIEEGFKDVLQKEITKERFERESGLIEFEEILNELKESINSYNDKKSELNEIIDKLKLICQILTK